MKHVSFGSTLKEARISKGLDLNTVSLRLRIRPDILKAIEEADFEHIPPRGYARNMINAYAHFLGLDSNDITRRYLDEAYSHQVTVEHSHMSDANQRRNQARAGQSPTGGTSSFNRVDASRAGRSSASQGSVNSLGRLTYSLEAEDKISGGVNRTAAARMSHEAAANARPHRAQRSTQVNNRYLNAVEGRSSTPSIDISAFLPYILGAAIVAVVLFVVLNLTVCHQDEPTETIPVTSGSTASTDSTDSSASADATTIDSSDASSTTSQTVTETAPTEFTLGYEVASGKSSYIEIYVDGKIVVSDDISGSKSGSYTSSSKIRFICDNISAVTLTIDDEKQSLKENSSGIYDKTFKFSSILKKWKKNHPDASSASSTSGSLSKNSTSSTTAGTAGTSATNASTTSSSGTTSSGSSTTSSSDSASDASSLSDAGTSSSGTLSVTGAADGSSSS